MLSAHTLPVHTNDFLVTASQPFIPELHPPQLLGVDQKSCGANPAEITDSDWLRQEEMYPASYPLDEARNSPAPPYHSSELLDRTEPQFSTAGSCSWTHLVLAASP